MMWLTDSWLGVSATALALYIIVGAIFRLFLSPLSRFPGPKLAALTLWYEFYYDVILPGQYTLKIERMHRKYGPIIRINPYEIHINDPSYYNEVYAGGGRKRDKWRWVVNQFGIPDSFFTTVEHEKHRMRRSALNPFFSTASVKRLQPVIEERLAKLMERFKEFKEDGKVMTLSLAFAAFTNDVVMQYAYARNENRTEAKDFDPSFHDASIVGTKMGHMNKQLTWILPIMQSLPDWITVKLNPDMASYVKMQSDTLKQIKAIQNPSFQDHKNVSHDTIFHEILNSKLPAEEKSSSRLWQDGQATVIAGTLTTAWSLSVTAYHLLAFPDILRNLQAELKEAIPDPTKSIPYSTLEQLPYLTGCIKEGLRLSNGVSTRLQRIAPDEDLVFTDTTTSKRWTIPRGTPISMTQMLIHHDESIFAQAKTFRPERWLENPSLEKFFVPFSKGSRQCMGINLAYAELYLALATIFRVYGSKEAPGEKGYLELFETGDKNWEIVGDGITPLVAKGSKGIRMKVRK